MIRNAVPTCEKEKLPQIESFIENTETDMRNILTYLI
jgi:hypothetical protein